MPDPLLDPFGDANSLFQVVPASMSGGTAPVLQDEGILNENGVDSSPGMTSAKLFLVI